MNYKRIIRNQNVRFAILKSLSWIPDKTMLSIQYRIKLGRKCNFNHPERWTEKLQLYKMYYRKDILPICVDKYDVRSYVKQKDCEDTLVKLYGVWDSPSDIDFSKLPHQYVLKTTNGSGGENVLIVKNNDKVNTQKIARFLHNSLNKEVNAGREWAYTGISHPRIICEELLINNDNPDAGIEDFKILCFSGVPKYVIVDKDRYIDHRRNFYTTEWERINVTTDHEQFEQDFPKPNNLEDMLEIASKLSAGFPFVRVDLYNINGKIYFGELTFYPWTGYVQFTPDSFDFELGNLMDCSSFC